MFRMGPLVGAKHLCVAFILFAFVTPFGAIAAEQPRPVSPGAEEVAPPKIQELLSLLADAKARQLLMLLADPNIQEWLEKQGRTNATIEAVQKTDDSVEGYLNSRASAIHTQIVTLVGAIPGLPDEFARASIRYGATHGDYAWTWVLLNLAVFGALGLGAEWLFRKMTEKVRDRLNNLPLETAHDRLRLIAWRFALGIGMVVAFATGSLGSFLIVGRDPMLRGTILGYLLAFAIVRIAIATGDLIFAPREERFRIVLTDAVAARFWCWRLTAFVSWFVLGWLITQQCRSLGFSFEGLQLVAYTLGLGLVAIALEAVWRGRIAPHELAAVPPAKPHYSGRGARNTLLSIGIVLLWALWIAEPGIDRVGPSFWLIFVGITLPLAIFMTQRAIKHLLQPPTSSDAVETPPSVVTISLERGVRALWIIGAAGVLAWAWGVDLVGLAGEDTLFARFVHGVLSAVIILLVTDVVWHAMRVTIDAKLAASADPGQPNTDEARRRARLRTLLPIFRNVLFIVVMAVAVMMALAAMGVQIGPLIAGAGVVGVAIGFGAQTFVRDVIAGIFYLMDDAFRVGEYIQSGNYKGTVEGFSIRSVKLRHHRGPVYTVPFSLLGAVQNQSRDWVIDKLMIGITYDSDLERARKLIKGIGQELAADPEFGPLIIEPLKMQGVENFGDFAVHIRMKMMTLPGEQFVIRRKALAMIKKAFDENGIKFALPTVQVASESEPATAAVAQRALELVPGGLTESKPIA